MSVILQNLFLPSLITEIQGQTSVGTILGWLLSQFQTPPNLVATDPGQSPICSVQNLVPLFFKPLNLLIFLRHRCWLCFSVFLFLVLWIKFFRLTYMFFRFEFHDEECVILTLLDRHVFFNLCPPCSCQSFMKINLLNQIINLYGKLNSLWFICFYNKMLQELFYTFIKCIDAFHYGCLQFSLSNLGYFLSCLIIVCYKVTYSLKSWIIHTFIK